MQVDKAIITNTTTAVTDEVMKCYAMVCLIDYFHAVKYSNTKSFHQQQ